jgi:glyoxylase-like metal-dependent hydrolase (beta-lactamase superfamily II)
MTKWLSLLWISFFFAPLPAAPAVFEQISDHVYVLPAGPGGHSIGAVVTKEGIVLIDPPRIEDLSAATEALKRITTSRVRWIVCTSYRRVHAETLNHFHRLGAAFISHKALDDLVLKAEATDADEARTISPWFNRPSRNVLPTPRFNFGRQMRLFPEKVEVRILALQHRAHTGGDIVVLVPDEKVLLVGDLYGPGRFPDIDTEPGFFRTSAMNNGVNSRHDGPRWDHKGIRRTASYLPFCARTVGCNQTRNKPHDPPGSINACAAAGAGREGCGNSKAHRTSFNTLEQGFPVDGSS